MASFNMASIIAKVNKWAETSEGQAELNRIMQAKASSGALSSGGIGIDVKELDDLLEDLREAIISAGKSLPESLQSSLMTLSGGGGGGWSSEGDVMSFIYIGELNFGDLGFRASFSGSGAYMLPLFDSGWASGNYAYGMWGGERIRSRKTFGGLHFVSKGVASFMKSVNNDIYNISVTTGDGWV